MAAFLLFLMLTVSKTVGLSPLTTNVKMQLDPKFAAGTVCLVWANEEQGESSDCWTVENPIQRTYLKTLKNLRTGVWVVGMSEVGQDTKGNAFEKHSPWQRIEVY